MKPLVIYHADCTDGFAAAFCAWLALGDSAEYLPCAYGDKSPDMMAEKVRNREVYILDFSFPRLVMDHIFQAATRVVWLDHHKTAFEMYAGPFEFDQISTVVGQEANDHVLLDNTKSGAMLAWEYFHPDLAHPTFIELIDDRDRWVFQYPQSKAFHAGLASLKPWVFGQWESKLYPHDRTYELINTGEILLDSQHQQVLSMAKQARKCNIELYSELYSGLACNASLHISELGHELANRSGTFGLIWYLAADRKVKCSLRSNGDYDVSAVAKAFGGGGHKNAAGFETDTTTLLGWLDGRPTKT